MAQYRHDDYQAGWSGLTYEAVQAISGKNIVSNDRQAVNSLIASAEQQLASICNRQFRIDAEYKQRIAYGETSITLRSVPIDLVTDVLVDDATSAPLTLGTHYYINYPNQVLFLQIFGNNYYSKIELVYKIHKFWGEDAKQAVAQMVLEQLQHLKVGGNLQEFSFANARYVLKADSRYVSKADATPVIQSAINKYKLITL